MRFMPTSRLIGTFTAAVIALSTFTAVPAYADRERDQRNARAAAAILGIIVLGKIIYDKKKDEKVIHNTHKPAPKRVNRNVQHHKHRTYNDNNAHEDNNRRVQPRALPRRVDTKQLPKNCFRSFNTRQGKINMFGRRCLERNFRFANRLPQNCAQRVRTNQGTRVGFDARCLRRNGYTLARG